MPEIPQVDGHKYVKALSHPLRVRILGILEERAASPVELAAFLGSPTLGTVSYHVRLLRDLGLVELVRETPRRGAIEHHYRATPRPKGSDGDWQQVSVIAKQAVISSELTQTAEAAARAAAVGGFDSDHARLERLRLTLDAQGVKQLSKAVAKLVVDAQRIQDAASKRIGSGAIEADTALVVMMFDAIGVPDPSAGRPPGKALKPRRR